MSSVRSIPRVAVGRLPRNRWKALFSLSLVLLTAIGCALSGSPREESTPSGFPILRVGGVGISGQPAVPELDEIRDAGFRTVVTFREPGEIDWDEKAAANAAGLRYAEIPVRPAVIEAALLVRIRSIIDSSPQPVLLHCASGNRAALIWGMLEAGKRPADEIVEIARAGGLNDRSVVQLQDYLDRKERGEAHWR